MQQPDTLVRNPLGNPVVARVSVNGDARSVWNVVGDFAGFAHWAAAQHQLTLPVNTDWTHYLQRGARRLQLVQRIELVRHLFRRPLELWLMLDKALYLQQHGYEVRLTQLCDYHITPRNLLLSAIKQS